jgi:hypothetical protein
LRLGKFATDAKLRIVRGAQEWVFGLKATDLVPSGIKLPAVLSKEDDDQFYERMFLLEQLDTMIKGLFGLFLKVRVSPRWMSDELPTIQRWIAGGDVEPDALDPVALGVRAVEVVAPPLDPGAPVKSWPPLAEFAAALEPVRAAIGAGAKDETAESDEGRPAAAAKPRRQTRRRIPRQPRAKAPKRGAADAPETTVEPDADFDEPALDVPDVLADDDLPPWETPLEGDVPPWAAAADDED